MSTPAPAVTEPKVETPAAAALPAPAPDAQAKAKEVTNAFFKNYGVKQEEAKASEPAKTEAPKAKEEPKAPPAQKVEEKKDEPAPREPERRQSAINREELEEVTTAAATAATRAVLEANKASTPKVESPEVQLPRNITRKLELLGILEKDNPAMKGIAVKTQEFHKKGGIKDSYQAKWELANPGKDFDSDSDEHDAFYAKNDPLMKVEDDDWDEARDKLVIQKAEEIASKTTKSALGKREQDEAKETAKTSARSSIDAIALSAISKFSPELAEKAKTPEKLRTLDVDDPIAEHSIKQAVERHAPVIEATIEVFSGVPFNEKNPLHAAVSDVGVYLEDRILALPLEQRMRGDKKFVTVTEYMAMNAGQKKKAWALDKDDIVKFLGTQIENDATALYGRLSKGRQVTNPSPVNGTVKASEPAPAAVSSDSPSVGGSAAPPPGGKPNTTTGSGVARDFFSNWGGK